MELREDERGPLVVVEGGEQGFDLRQRRGIDEHGLGSDRGAGIAAPAADVAADRVRARPAGDREQPGARARVATEARERPHHPHERVLGDVVGVLAADEMRAQPPHIGLTVAHDGREREPVAVSGRDQVTRQLVHPGRKRTR